ncbi:MAG: tRNA pseudouridine(38-40) synthase TruA [Bacteroidota bacterium]
MPTYRLLIEYDGLPFHGWQIQPDRPSVQGAIETALATVTRHQLNVVGSGRTDAGVHARGQVAHIVSETPLDLFRVQRSLNGLLRPHIGILAIEEMPADFHARYDARRRRYHYGITTLPRPLERHTRWLIRPTPDIGRMNEAARAFLGQHDYDAFCRIQSETKNRICSVYHAAWQPDELEGTWRFVIEADRFLHGMVRAIVGTLVQIGHGKRPADDVQRLLASKDRRQAGPAAPAHGLALVHVGYDELATANPMAP